MQSANHIFRFNVIKMEHPTYSAGMDVADDQALASASCDVS